MAPRKRRPFAGLLCKPIDLADAKPRGLRVSLAEPPNESDVKTHIMEEIEARYIALDTFFSLDSNSLNIWEERAKALLTYRFEIPAYALQSWEHLAPLFDAPVRAWFFAQATKQKPIWCPVRVGLR